MSRHFDLARARLCTEAVHAWEAMTRAQRSALRRATPGYVKGPLRILEGTNGRTRDALRRMGVLVELTGERCHRDLTDMGVFLRSTGLAWERSMAKSRKAGRELHR
jgi:hypothetical protein